MLPKLRIVSVLLLGLGMALAVIGFLLPRFIHADGRLPLDIGEATWTLRDDDALIVSPLDPDHPYTGPATRQLHLKVQDPATEDTATVRIGSTLTRDAAPAPDPAPDSVGQPGPDDQPGAPAAPQPAPVEGDGLVQASVWDYVMDRLTGLPVGDISVSDTVVMPPATTTIDGVWLKFPAHTRAEMYQVIDETLREAYPAEPVGTEEIEGREVLHFRQEVPSTNVATKYPGLFATLDVPQVEQSGEDGNGGRTERLYLFHSATRDIFVEPVSGLVVRAQVAVDEFYGRPDGTRVRDAMSFNGTMTAPQTEELMGLAVDIGEATSARAWSVALIVMGAVLVLAGAVGASGVMQRGPRPARA